MQRDRVERQAVVVVGGGLVGLAIAYGLLRRGRQVVLLDRGDASRPASFGNFGLVWLQSKGEGLPAYSAWTARSVRLWPRFSSVLAEETGIDVGYRQAGGLHLCLGEQEAAERSAFVERMSNQAGALGYDLRMLDRAETRDLAPQIGERVVGASYCPLDGHSNPMLLLRALLLAALAKGLDYRPNSGLRSIRRQDEGYALTLDDGVTLQAGRVVLAAGLANNSLAAQLGKSFPVGPQRGQILVTRRLPRFLDLPTTHVRQTEEGSVLLGDSKEDVGMNYGTSAEAGRKIAARAIASFPILADAPVVRTWGALRVMSPDGFPLYQQWSDLPDLHVLSCHSGVTLAAVHAEVLAAVIDGDAAALAAAPELGAFTTERFDVQNAQAI